MKTFRIPSPAELAAKKSAAPVQTKPEQKAHEPASFKGFTDDGMAIYHIPGGIN